MTLGTSGLLLLLAAAGIWLSARYLRAKPTLRIVCITVLSLFALLCIAYIGFSWMRSKTSRPQRKTDQDLLFSNSSRGRAAAPARMLCGACFCSSGMACRFGSEKLPCLIPSARLHPKRHPAHKLSFRPWFVLFT